MLTIAEYFLCYMPTNATLQQTLQNQHLQRGKVSEKPAPGITTMAPLGQMTTHLEENYAKSFLS